MNVWFPISIRPEGVRRQLNGHDRSDKAHAFAEHHVAATRDADAALQSHREGRFCFSPQTQLGVHDVAEICDLADE